ncbi:MULTISPECIES: hypothetical protein [unclassified Mesorhizobium]|uniref:hypothetical protein n=1 Tax=unclassified Mesorhizobium TaxID=325217 RepID=UPI00333CD3D1
MAHIFRPAKAVAADVRPPRSTPKPKADYRVPSAAEVLPDLGNLLERENTISGSIRADRAELKLLERELAADETPEIHPEVAALLGDDPVGSKAMTRKAIAGARHRLAVAETALGEIQKRRTALETKAGLAVCDAVRPEVSKRVAALVASLQAADTAHGELNELVLAIEAEGVSWGSLGPIRPFFLGDARDVQRRIATYTKDVREAGYVD